MNSFVITQYWPDAIRYQRQFRCGSGYEKRLLGGAFSVPSDVLFSNSMLEDMEKIWALRDVIPDPNKIPLKSDIKEKGN